MKQLCNFAVVLSIDCMDLQQDNEMAHQTGRTIRKVEREIKTTDDIDEQLTKKTGRAKKGGQHSPPY